MIADLTIAFRRILREEGGSEAHDIIARCFDHERDERQGDECKNQEAFVGLYGPYFCSDVGKKHGRSGRTNSDCPNWRCPNKRCHPLHRTCVPFAANVRNEPVL